MLIVLNKKERELYNIGLELISKYPKIFHSEQYWLMSLMVNSVYYWRIVKRKFTKSTEHLLRKSAPSNPAT